MKKLSLLVALGLLFVFIQSCEQDPVEGPEEEVAPQLPPLETFVMPFEGFENADTSGLINDEFEVESRSTPTTFRNWWHGASNVVAWNVILGFGSALPVAAFGEAFNHNPVSAGGGVYIWSYDFELGGKMYTAALSGQFIDGGGTKWEMVMSQEGGFSDVTWYTGTVSRDASSATWVLNQQVDNSTISQPAFSIEYNNDAVAGEFFIRYTDIRAGSEGNGNYIEFRTQPNEPFNRAYDIFIEENQLLEIQWESPTGEGRIRNAKIYDDNDWHCWNTQLMDIDC